MTNFIIFTAIFHNDVPIKPLLMGNFGLHFIYFFNWRISTLQWCVGLCHTMKISHNYIYNYFILIIYIYIYIYISPPPEPHSLWTPAIVNISASSVSPMNTWLWPHVWDLKTQRIWFWSPPCFSLTHPTNTHTSVFFFRIFSTTATLNFFPIQYTWWTESIFNIVSTVNLNWCAIPSLSAAPSFSLWLRRANQN